MTAEHSQNLVVHRRTVLRHDVIQPFTLNTYVVDVTEADVMTPHRTDQLCVTARSLQVQWRYCVWSATKLAVVHVKQFFSFYRNQKFITVLAKANHCGPT